MAVVLRRPLVLFGTLTLLACGESGGEDAPLDAELPDARASEDASALDAGARDAEVDASGDAGCTPFVMPSDCTIPDDSALPSKLRCTGLYRNFAARELGCGVHSYTPAYELWSDGAQKRRYVQLPEGSKLNARDPNAIVYPVGTKFWKEFRSSDGARLLETRLLQKSEAGWVYTSYVWDAAGNEATQNNDGVDNLHGTGHVVPTRDQCDECHGGRTDKVLGWDAFMLGDGAEGLTRAELMRLGLFEAGSELAATPVPGDPVERAALGYLHANCGISCHNDGDLAKARDTGLMLRLEADTTTAPRAPAFTTALHRVPGDNAKLGGLTTPGGAPPRSYFRDLIPQNRERSLLLVRMEHRGIEAQMPQIASNRVDTEGVAAIRAWIEQMTPERGYAQDAGM